MIGPWRAIENITPTRSLAWVLKNDSIIVFIAFRDCLFVVSLNL